MIAAGFATTLAPWQRARRRRRRQQQQQWTGARLPPPAAAAAAAAADGAAAAKPPPILIRPARPEDVPAIAALERACAPLSAGWSAAQVEEELGREIAVVLVADGQEEEEEQQQQQQRADAAATGAASSSVAGWAAAWRVAGELQVLSVAVNPARRRAGVGRALLTGLLALVEEEEEEGVGEGDAGSTSASRPAAPLATLELRADNAAAAALYASCGFEEVGRRKGYYDGGKVDALLLEKRRRKRAAG
jgi:[ribosomal protein S18]-alanine N-acetyltransferase